MTGTILLFLAVLQWLVFWARLLFRRGDTRRAETPFLFSTLLAAIVWMAVGLQAEMKHEPRATKTIQTRGCAALREGMSTADAYAAMGDPTRVVSEADTRGPGAEALVYDDARCVAHVLGGKVHSVD